MTGTADEMRMNIPSVNTFRAAPHGRWSTGETVPWGESIAFYPNGAGLHQQHSGLGCTPTDFEWEPARDWVVRIRLLDRDQWASPDIREWVRFTVGPGRHYDQPALWLTIDFLPIPGRDTLWYVGPAADGPNRGGTDGGRPME